MTITQERATRDYCFPKRLSDIKKAKLESENVKLIYVILLITGLLLALLSVVVLIEKPTSKPNIFVGMSIGYGDEMVAIKLIDKVVGYVNLIILGSLNLTTNTEALTRVCDYMYQKNLYFIVYVGFGAQSNVPPNGPDATFFAYAVNKYEDKFLGVYLYDEVGGKLMDGAHSLNVSDANDYSDAAVIYTHHLKYFLDNTTKYYEPAKFNLYTSDYALYWYDYVGGYDVIFTEFVGNQSRQIATGLCRGAAKTLKRDWGVIITWSNQFKPSIEDPEQLYSDMVLAYQNGARYVVVFNSPGNFTPTTEFGTLTAAHLEAMKNFWEYASVEPAVEEYPSNTAYVLPRDYGFGFREPNDRIWGKWSVEPLSSKLWIDVNSLLATYTLNLDIVYETEIGDLPINLPYNRLFFWNGTIIEK